MSYLGPYPTVGLADEIADMERELKMREEVVYPEQVRQNKLSKKTAAHRIACTRATLNRLKALVPEQPSLFDPAATL